MDRILRSQINCDLELAHSYSELAKYCRVVICTIYGCEYLVGHWRSGQQATQQMREVSSIYSTGHHKIAPQAMFLPSRNDHFLVSE